MKSKLYTRTGDRGTTSLVDGSRLSKSDLRLEAYGTIDELNSYLGVVLAADEMAPQLGAQRTVLEVVQNKLFDLGAYLATSPDQTAIVMEGVTDADVEQLEMWIDVVDSALPQLRKFVIPGGTIVAAHCQVARSICRRAERLMVALAQESSVGDPALRYVNRLSDLLFALARHCNVAAQHAEPTWQKQ